MQPVLVVIYEQQGRVVLDLDGETITLSVDEAMEIAEAIVAAAERYSSRTTASAQPTPRAMMVHSSGG